MNADTEYGRSYICTFVVTQYHTIDIVRTIDTQKTAPKLRTTCHQFKAIWCMSQSDILRQLPEVQVLSIVSFILPIKSSPRLEILVRVHIIYVYYCSYINADPAHVDSAY